MFFDHSQRTYEQNSFAMNKIVFLLVQILISEFLVLLSGEENTVSADVFIFILFHQTVVAKKTQTCTYAYTPICTCIHK